jgi:hypothetical protein
MSKISDCGLLFLIIGTLFILITLYLGFGFKIINYFTFSVFQIIGWILFSLSFIPLLLTKDEYRIIVLKNGFPLKIDHLIIAVCGLTTFISLIFLVSINSMIYGIDSGYNGFLFLTIIPSATAAYVFLSSRRKKESNIND